MSANDTEWWVLLSQLLDESDGSLMGDRTAVFDFMTIHARLTKENP